MSYSISRISDTVDFQLAMAKGEIAGNISVNVFGLNPDVDGAEEDIWAQGGTWVQPTAARIHALTSSSVNDTSAGTGARTISINGLNGSYADVTETLTLNGTSAVNTVNSFIIIHNMTVLTAGSGGTNAGNIIATAATDSTVSIGILATRGKSQFCIYQVPAGFTGYLFGFSGGFQVGAGSNVTCNIELFIKPFGGVYNLTSTLALQNGATSYEVRDYLIPIQVTEKSIIKLTGVVSANNCVVHGSFDLILTVNL